MKRLAFKRVWEIIWTVALVIFCYFVITIVVAG